MALVQVMLLSISSAPNLLHGSAAQYREKNGREVNEKKTLAQEAK